MGSVSMSHWRGEKYILSDGKLEGTRPLWEDNIKMEIGWMVWTRFICFKTGKWRALMNMVMSIYVLLKGGKFID
jgi:hypothetical protein